ncbi:arrestin domain-containing protein 3-like isoform X2 [Kryptolebias marmoratus]|uniref:arrestin domain-containing protein 3-like isoform X2 n=1 Tax=Kryptolebias marmoratus TaxID=37003 RepID=UPI0007F878B0|nr:arrestin domain-containing protein 3-like isoform X2 [Kryptolebias marmoratus]
MFKKTINNFNIHFDAVNERSTFSSGDVIRGQVSFDLTKETEISSVMMRLRGGASVHWSSSAWKMYRNHYSAEEDYFDHKSALIHEGPGEGKGKLPAGRHVYPFTWLLPRGDFPSSFRGPHGHISYTLTVAIRRPWRLSKDFVTELNFVNHGNVDQPELWKFGFI